MVRRVYAHYTTAGWSIGAITRWLNEQRVATRKPGARWERSMVWAMLRNPAYRGTACFGKTRVATRQRVTRPLRLRGGLTTRDSANHERPRDEWIEIPVPVLIDEPTFARAQELLHENKIRARRRTITPSLVQGLVSCRRVWVRALAHLDAIECSPHSLLSLPRLGWVAASWRSSSARADRFGRSSWMRPSGPK